VTGPQFGEALTVLFVTCRALAAWVIAAAFVVTVCLYTVVLTGAWATRRAWRAVRRDRTGPLAASEPECHPSPPRAGERPSGPQQRPAPSWAHDEQEAA
jgi:hypothetical protein